MLFSDIIINTLYSLLRPLDPTANDFNDLPLYPLSLLLPAFNPSNPTLSRDLPLPHLVHPRLPLALDLCIVVHEYHLAPYLADEFKHLAYTAQHLLCEQLQLEGLDGCLGGGAIYSGLLSLLTVDWFWGQLR